MDKFLIALGLFGVINQPCWSATKGLFLTKTPSRPVPGVAQPHQQNLDERVPSFEEAMAMYRKSAKRELSPDTLKTKKGLKGNSQNAYQSDIKELRSLFSLDSEPEGSTPGPTYLPVLLNMPTEPIEQVQQTEVPIQQTEVPVQETTQPTVQETTQPIVPETTTTAPETTTEPVQVQQTEAPVQETTPDEFAGYQLGVKNGEMLNGPVGAKGAKRMVGKGYWKGKGKGKKIDPATPLLPSLRG